MSKESDFLSWDSDIDLDFLLEEYTDYDNVENDLESDVEECVVVKKRKLDQENLPPTTRTIYTCPVCSKQLKTIAGFRGHTSRKHGRNDLKANDNKSQSARASKIPSDTTSNYPVVQVPVKQDTCELSPDSFKESFQVAVHSLKADELQQLLGGPNFSVLCDFTLGNCCLEDFYFSLFTDLFSSGIEISSALQRESLLRKLHTARINKDLRTKYINLYTSLGFEISSVHNFVQILLLTLLEKILSTQISVKTAISKERQLQISDGDQQILFYISGYILKSLNQKYSKCESFKDRLTVVNSLQVDCVHQPTTFVTKFQTWTRKKDRGGLRFPCDDFFLLIRELEIVVRNTIEENCLTSSSLNLEPLKECLMEEFMVKHYSSKIFSCELEECPETPTKILEDVVHLFLTIRGNAMVRIQKNKLAKVNLKCQPSKSLRGNLKQ